MSKRTRRAVERRSRRPRLRIRWIPILIVAVLLLGGYAVATSFGAFQESVGQRLPDLGRTHLQPGQTWEYNSHPATSGPHAPAPARWGVYSTQLPDEVTVHNLEHGGIVIAYNGIPPEGVQRLTALRNGYPRGTWPEVKIVVHPYDKIPPGTIAVAAWTWLDTMTAYDEARILAFIRAHMGKCCEPVP